MNFFLNFVKRRMTVKTTSSIILFVEVFLSSVLLFVVLVGSHSMQMSIEVTENSSFSPLIKNVSEMLTFLIMLVSVILIQNSFFISSVNKIKAFSQVLSLGATQKQLFLFLCLELFIIASVGVGLAVIVASIGISFSFEFLNSIYAVNERIGDLKMIVSLDTVMAFFLAVFLSLSFSIVKSLMLVNKLTPKEGMNQPIKIKQVKVKIWNDEKTVPSQLAMRNLKRNTSYYRIISSGIMLCFVLLYTCISFAFGTYELYSTRQAPFAYRVYIWAEDGIYPENILDECMALDRDLKTIQIEEMNTYSYNSEKSMAVNIRLLVMEDYDFENWYGELLPVKEDSISCIKIDDLISDDLDSEFKINGNLFSFYDKTDLMLPMGIANTDSDITNIIYVTNRSAFNSSFVNTKSERYFSIYYDVDDATVLNKEIEELLSAFSVRYVIQDYTKTSDWQLQGVAFSTLLMVFAICFPVFIFVLFIAQLVSVVLSNILLRKKEFALMRSIGLTKKNVLDMIVYESFSYIKNALLYGLPIGVAIAFLISRRLGVGFFTALPIYIILLPVIFVFMINYLTIKFSVKSLSNLSLSDIVKDME